MLRCTPALCSPSVHVSCTLTWPLRSCLRRRAGRRRLTSCSPPTRCLRGRAATKRTAPSCSSEFTQGKDIRTSHMHGHVKDRGKGAAMHLQVRPGSGRLRRWPGGTSAAAWDRPSATCPSDSKPLDYHVSWLLAPDMCCLRSGQGTVSGGACLWRHDGSFQFNVLFTALLPRTPSMYPALPYLTCPASPPLPYPACLAHPVSIQVEVVLHGGGRGARAQEPQQHTHAQAAQGRSGMREPHPAHRCVWCCPYQRLVCRCKGARACLSKCPHLPVAIWFER